MSSSLKLHADEALFLELARRDYDLAKLKDAENTHKAQMVKIAEAIG